MRMWFKKDDTNKNYVNSDEYERLAKRITELASEVGICKAASKLLQTDVDNLRGKFNRKLKGLEQEEKVEPKEETEKYINGDFIGIG